MEKIVEAKLACLPQEEPVTTLNIPQPVSLTSLENFTCRSSARPSYSFMQAGDHLL
jgi:hypothetical protein